MNTIIKRTKVRYGILIFLFLATVFNYADRATLSVVAPIMSKELGFDPEAMGLAFSAFGISYVIMQLPGRLAAGSLWLASGIRLRTDWLVAGDYVSGHHLSVRQPACRIDYLTITDGCD